MGDWARELLGTSLSRLRAAWRGNDRPAIALYAALLLAVAYAAVGAYFLRASGDPLGIYLDEHREQVFVGVVLLVILGLAALSRLASPPRQPAPAGLAPARPPETRWPAHAAGVGRWFYAVAALLGLVWFWQTWVTLPRFEEHPDRLCIYVARFWDPEKQSCNTEGGRRAQHLLVRAIEDESRKHESLAGRVIVRPLGAGVWAKDPAVGSDQASRLARRLNADLLVWGSLTKGHGADVYWVSVARAEPGPSLSVGETAQKVVISTDPCPPELSQRPLLLASFVLGYGAYAAEDHPSAIPVFEALLSQLGDVGAPRGDTARVAFYLGTSHLTLSLRDQPDHLGPAMQYLEQAVSLADGEEMSVVSAAALNNWGTTLLGWARRKQGAEAERLLAEACEKYEAAVKIKPELHEALNNWGNALLAWANLKQGAEAERLLAEACEKYEAAVKIKPELHEALTNWGNALLAWANLKKGAEAERLFAEACEKYEAAVKIKPEFHEALYNWGNALLMWAVRKQGAEAERLFAEACEKYEAAVKIKLEFHEALGGWGSALGERAELKEGAEAERLFGEACEKYEAALEIKPDNHGILCNWSRTLLMWAARKQGAEAETLWRQAKEKTLQAEDIQPGAGAYRAACASARLGEEDECRKWLERCRELGTLPSRKHMETDPHLDSVRDKAWFKEMLKAAPE